MPDFQAVTAAALARHREDLLAHRGRTVVYTPAVGASYTLTAILNSGDAVEVAEPGAHYVLWAPRTSFQAEPQRGDEATIGGDTFRVADVQRESTDGEGYRLVLRYKRS